MIELTFKLEFPRELEDKTVIILKKLVEEMQEEFEFSLAKDILEESEL